MYTTSELCEVVTTEVQAMVSQAKVVDDSDWRKELPKWTVFRTVFKRTYSFLTAILRSNNAIVLNVLCCYVELSLSSLFLAVVRVVVPFARQLEHCSGFAGSLPGEPLKTHHCLRALLCLQALHAITTATWRTTCCV